MTQESLPVGRNLRLIRIARGMTQVELASKIGCAHGTIANWENSVRQPRYEELYKLAAVLDVPVTKFFEDLESCILI